MNEESNPALLERADRLEYPEDVSEKKAE